MILDLRAVLSTLGILLMFLGAALLMPMGVAIYYGETSWWSFGVSAVLAAGVGAASWRGMAGKRGELGVREGFAIVALAWFVLSLVGALPFVFSGVLESYTDAFFETMSGFTTTGATIFGGESTPTIENLPRGFLFWRSLAHWLGGMGIIVLTLAIMPILGVGGMQLFKAEVPGPSADKLTPRVQETAKRLWLIYVGFTVVEVVLLLPAMGLFDAVNHSFATMATGGFSTKNASLAHYQSAYVDWVVTVFMIVAGTNFALHYRLLKGRADPLPKDTELKVYLSIIGFAGLAIALATWAPLDRWLGETGSGYESFLEALRFGAFQAAAIITTTGFGTADYELWAPVAQTILFLLFFVGGMAGSTGGGVKVVRQVLLFKSSFRSLKQLIHPQALIPVRLNHKVVSPDVLRNVLSFIVLYFGLIGFGTLALGLCDIDLYSAVTATMSAVGNVGPAFGAFGPSENYAAVPAAGKWILSVLMMAGRLEIYTLLVLFVPAFWRA